MSERSSKHRRVLIVSFWFPPTNVVGAARIGKFAKYLPSFGWEPLVLTVNKVKRSISATLPVEIEESKIIRTPYFGLADFVTSRFVAGYGNSQNSSQTISWKYKFYVQMEKSLRPIYRLPALKMLITDPAGWYPFAVKKGLEIVRKYQIDALFSSFGPSTSHLIAAQLQRKTGIPWIADFRDLWSQHPYYPKNQPFHSLEEYIEKRVINNSKKLITINELAAKELASLHHKEVLVISNGFDDEEYNLSIPLTSKFTLTYTGHILPGVKTPFDMLFSAIAELKEEQHISQDDFELRFFGGNIAGIDPSSTLLPLTTKFGINNLTKIYDEIPRPECVKVQKESTALLVLLPIDNSSIGVYSGKLFEYIGAQRPILAITIKGDLIEHLLDESGTGKVASSKDGIKEILSKWIIEFKQQGNITSHYSPQKDIIARHTRKEKARKLSEVLDEVASLAK